MEPGLFGLEWVDCLRELLRVVLQGCEVLVELVAQLLEA